MKHLTSGVKDVVLATDFTSHSRAAFDAGVRIARLFSARLHVLHVNEEEVFFATNDSADVTRFLDHVARKRTQWLSELAEEAVAEGVVAIAVSRQGVASEGIVAYADEVDAGVVVIGAIGTRRLSKLLTGSTAKQVLRRVHRPVLMVPAEATVRPASEGGTFSNVLYPTDLSEASRDGLRVAEELIRRAEGELVLLHVLKLPTMIPSIPGEPPIMLPGGTVDGLEAKLTGELAAVARSVPNTTVSTLIEVHGDAAEGIAEVARREGVELIIIPRHSRRSVTGFFFGRTAENLARIAPVPVLAFAPDDEI